MKPSFPSAAGSNVVAVSMLLVSGCAAEIAAGAATSNPFELSRPVIALGGQIQRFRSSATTLGGRLNMLAESEAHPMRFRSAMLDAGYHFVPARPFPLGLGAEFAFQAGGGEPAVTSYDAIGVYMGARGSVIYRLKGTADVVPQYALFAETLDMVLTLQGGTWATPEGSARTATAGEVGILIGLRLNLATDVTTVYPGLQDK